MMWSIIIRNLMESTSMTLMPHMLSVMPARRQSIHRRLKSEIVLTAKQDKMNYYLIYAYFF